jgi:hypothetical protein
MLPCNNTAFPPDRRIKRTCRVRRPLFRSMSEDEDLARRFFALWEEYLTALAGDPGALEPLRRWLALVAGMVPGNATAGPAGDAAAAAGASGGGEPVVAELARRVDELAERVAALERAVAPAAGKPRRRAAGRPRRNDRATRP